MENKNIMDKYDIKKLVDETFIELGYVDVLSKDYIKKCVNDSFEKIINKTYSHKPHLADLPGDLNTTNPKDLQNRHDELLKKIDEIEKDYGYFPRAYPTKYSESDSAKENRMAVYEKKFKKLDKKIYKECKDLVDELKPLMEEANKIYSKYADDEGNGYEVLSNYGELGMLNPYEEFRLFCDQFKSKNAGKGNKINGSGFYTYNPENFSFEKGNTYLNYVLGNIISNASYIINEGSIALGEKMPKNDMDLLPKEKTNKILKKLSDLQVDYDYERRKVQDNYQLKRVKQINKLRDYRYELSRLIKYCNNNDIDLNYSPIDEDYW